MVTCYACHRPVNVGIGFPALCGYCVSFPEVPDSGAETGSRKGGRRTGAPNVEPPPQQCQYMVVVIFGMFFFSWEDISTSLGLVVVLLLGE
jgi:hypothetical protein